MADKSVANGGSAIGEAIGHNMEVVLHKCIEDFLEDYSCHFLKESGYNPKTRKHSKKLLLYDDFGNDYNINGVITDESMRPLVLLESKYIRYKKHNRDKGSWICNAHSAIRKRYSSIRSSIAVLAGSWSKSSLAMIRSYDINVFLIPFDYIADILLARGIDFRWEEKEKEKAMTAWLAYDALPDSEKNKIGEEMVDLIKNKLYDFLKDLLDDSKTRELKAIAIEILTSKGEVKRYTFPTKEDAVEFLEQLSLDEEFQDSSLLTIYDIPEV